MAGSRGGGAASNSSRARLVAPPRRAAPRSPTPHPPATSRCSATSLYRRSREPADFAYLPPASLADCLPPWPALWRGGGGAGRGWWVRGRGRERSANAAAHSSAARHPCPAASSLTQGHTFASPTHPPTPLTALLCLRLRLTLAIPVLSLPALLVSLFWHPRPHPARPPDHVAVRALVRQRLKLVWLPRVGHACRVNREDRRRKVAAAQHDHGPAAAAQPQRAQRRQAVGGGGRRRAALAVGRHQRAPAGVALAV